MITICVGYLAHASCFTPGHQLAFTFDTHVSRLLSFALGMLQLSCHDTALYSRQDRREPNTCAEILHTFTYISGCTIPSQSQSGAFFFHLNDHCVMFKSAWQFWKNVTGRYEKYASDHAFGTLLANKLAYLWFFWKHKSAKNPGIGGIGSVSQTMA